MSEPVAIFAKVPISEKSYKSYLRTAPVADLAAFVFQELDQPNNDFYVFRYIKKEGFLFAFFCFNYGNITWLAGEESPVMKALQKLATYADTTDTGYIVASNDALNLPKESVTVAYAVNGKGYTKIDDVPDADWKQMGKDIGVHFFKKVSGDFPSEFNKGRIVEPAIVKKCRALAEKKRKEEVLKNLHIASFTSPIHFFGDYYYNGRYVYAVMHGRPVFLKGVNASAFRQTPYGASDGQYAVVGGTAVLTDTGTFKKLQKVETVFYKSATGVYDDKLHLIPGADPATFTVVDEYHAVDAANIYFNRIVIPKVTIGNYTMDTSGYYWMNVLLMGEKAVYVGPEKIAVDAATFRVLDFPDKSYSNYRFLAIAADKDGTIILYRDTLKADRPLQLIRNEDTAGFIATVKAGVATHFETVGQRDPELPGTAENTHEDYEIFTAWAAQYFDEYYNLHRQGYDFYVRINNYFYACFQEKHYDDILRMYDKVKDNAWVNPYLFHHTACCYARLGETKKAVDEVRKALVYGYEEMEKLWADEDLESLRDDTYYQTLHHYWEENKFSSVTIELMEEIVKLPVASDACHYLMQRLIKRVYFPDPSTVVITQDTPEQTAYLIRYKELLVIIYDQYFMPNTYSWGLEMLYTGYKDHPSLPVRIHAEMFNKAFGEAHFFIVREEYLKTCLEIAARVKAAIARITDEEKKVAVINMVTEMPMLDYVLHELIPETTA